MTGSDTDQGAAWMAAWQAGDESAFEALVRAHADRVHALLTRFLGPVPQREDLVQEVFLRVVRARETYVPTARFTTWLYRIVFNLAANEREKLRLRRTLSLDASAPGDPDSRGFDPADEDGPDPEADLARLDVVEAVRAAIESLPERQRMALVLAKYEGLSFLEIGEVLGVSEKAVKSTVHRARETLRERLAPFVREEVA
ncbi:RNA polymerase sigma factor [Engelhardtia mirabilis]|uniref:ECF RNA polymerase sigma factor SigW n=1 Tax=Engelhardtia mirabilis TaxID=2528011 RepID=A0A518BDB3_9BACT|nr:ECF RNA polymerase sigma factor SigW [Planctomycetes bacterium Pla133]QDU99306.1 ECF RNA polymerase sigma factor SigW [Planctomycetes bacterium Pla86]